MKKSALENQINLVIEKNNNLFNKCSELENELSNREDTIKKLLNEVEALKSENAELKVKFEELNRMPSVTETVLETTVYDDGEDLGTDDSITENADNSVVLDEDTSNETESTTFTEAVLYDEKDIDRIINIKSTLITNNKLDTASKAIGRVVLKCTEFCNEFISSGDINSKDLVNLALGRTEVFKSEVLTLASSRDISAEMFNAELNLKETSVIEYFELLLKQI